MRKLLTLLFTFTGLTVATVGYAANGVVDLTWGIACSPVVATITPTAGPTSVIASETGNDQTHDAYEVRFIMGSATSSVPDAWRFDASGCQTSLGLTINHLSKACPNFQGASASIQIKDFSFVPAGAIYA